MGSLKRLKAKSRRRCNRTATTLDPTPVYGAKSFPKASQIAPKMESKLVKMQTKNWLKNIYRFVLLWDAFVIDFWCQNGAKMGQELVANLHTLETIEYAKI